MERTRRSRLDEMKRSSTADTDRELRLKFIFGAFLESRSLEARGRIEPYEEGNEANGSTIIQK